MNQHVNMDLKRYCKPAITKNTITTYVAYYMYKSLLFIIL